VWSIVGSSNLDTRSVIWNDEIASIVLGHDFAGRMEAMFADDRASAQAIDLEGWAHRPLWDRMTDWAARTFDVLL
jgi:cardiolipin synthase